MGCPACISFRKTRQYSILYSENVEPVQDEREIEPVFGATLYFGLFSIKRGWIITWSNLYLFDGDSEP